MGLSDEDFMKEVIAEVRKNHTDVSEAHPSDEELSNYLKKSKRTLRSFYFTSILISFTISSIEILILDFPGLFSEKTNSDS